MIRIDCPFCGPRDHSEFAYVDAAVDYPALDAPREEWFEAVFQRENPMGRLVELWRHSHGCRAHLVIERDTATHEIFSVRMAHPGMGEACEAGGGADDTTGGRAK